MSSKAVILLPLLLGRIAAAEPDQASMPWQLHPITTANVVQLDTGVAVFRDPQGNIDIAETTGFSARYQLTDHWASTIQLGFVGNNAPGAALDGTSVGNPLAGATYTRAATNHQFALFAALAIPIGSGGGNQPDAPTARTNAASITAHPADEAMFDVNYASAILGADIAYLKRGFTAQAEATLLQNIRARGDSTAIAADAFRTRATIGGHLGITLRHRVSVGADLEYRRWLSHPTMLDAMADPHLPNTHQDAATLTASLGVRVHLHVGRASLSPGLAYTRGFDGLQLHGPTNITQQTNAIGVAIPVLF